MAGRQEAWRDIWRYGALLFGLTLPFWLAGALLPTRLLPGLNVSAFAIIVPTIAATLTVALAGGPAAVGLLFGSLRSVGRDMLPIAGAAVVVPLLAATLSWGLAAAEARQLAPASDLLALLAVFVLAAVLEEIGWSAFATARLQGVLAVPAIGLLVGVAWALWHIPSLVALGRSPEWIMWWSLWALAQRMIMVTLFVRGGSWIWAPVLFHAATNLAWQAAPDAFDPRLEAIAMSAMAAVVVLLWWRHASRETQTGRIDL